MRRGGIFFHLVTGFAVLLSLLATTATTSAQESTASLTIHNRICPVDYSGDDIFGDCHGNPSVSSLEFAIAGPVSAAGATDGDGNVVFAGLPVGAYDVSGGVPANVASAYVYCSVDGDPYNALPVTWTDAGVAIDVPAGAAVLCDWYNTPYALSDDGDNGDDGQDGDGAAEPPKEPNEESVDEPAPLVSVSLAAYNCDGDPGTQDPAAVCDPAPGVTVEVTQDDQPLGSVATDATGAAAIDAEEGATVILTEDMGTVAPGYLPVSGGVRTIESVAGGEAAVFVHVRVGEEDAGRLQVVNGSCPTSDDEPRTEFNVIGSPSSAGASSAPCLPTPNAPFTISGGSLPAGDIVVYTGDDGAWRGTLPAGNYTVFDDSGATQAVEVLAGETTVVTAIDYVPFPDGTLLVTKVRCTEGEEAGTTITVDDAPDEAGPSCAPSDGEFRLAEVGDGTSGPIEDFTLGANGEAEFTLRTGDYRLTDLTSGQTVTVTIDEAAVTAVTVRDVVLSDAAEG
ncbi:MAG: hypothetical protein ACRDJH_14980 [Thermomicrobiales bacterium]